VIYSIYMYKKGKPYEMMQMDSVALFYADTL